MYNSKFFLIKPQMDKEVINHLQYIVISFMP